MQSKKNNSAKKNKCKKIKIILTDVDGVLTDGGRYYSDMGEILKKFHVRDGMGVNLLLRNGIKTIIVTKENSKITKKWAKEMNITKIISGSLKKENELPKICKKFNVSEKRTKQWLKKSYIFRDDQILFLIIINNKKIGHIGIIDYNKSENCAEIGHVLRGDRENFPGVMKIALTKILEIGFFTPSKKTYFDTCLTYPFKPL